MTSTDSERIRGKVAAILSQRELVLNIGVDDGVEVGTKFVILNSKGIDVTDPDTGDVLGTVEVPKTVVKVVRVDGPHLSVARTFRTLKGTPGLYGTLLTTSALSGTPSRPETLDIASGSSLKAELSEEDSYIKRGDIALSTRGDEYDDLV
jgi:hypothetical protein